VSRGERVNNIHDVGGMMRFGPVRPEPDEPVFHEEWEGRVFALAAALLQVATVDEYRWSIEKMASEDYLGTSYYEKWLVSLEDAIVNHGVATRDELDARMRAAAAASGASR